MIGRTVGHYEIVEQLGTGGMGGSQSLIGGGMTNAINGEIIPALSGWQATGFMAATFAIVSILKLLRRRA
jgi:hypothetical protein